MNVGGARIHYRDEGPKDAPVVVLVHANFASLLGWDAWAEGLKDSYRVIRFFHVVLTWLWNNLYDGISVSGITRLKELAQTHEIVYIPCHRSHIDYLLLSYVLYQNGLTPPHIAAGRNLNLPSRCLLHAQEF